MFSSTGKASRYFTTEVYAASKKVAEWQFARAAQEGRVIYGAVRFTHIVENSIVSGEIEEKIKRGIVSSCDIQSCYLVYHPSQAGCWFSLRTDCEGLTCDLLHKAEEKACYDQKNFDRV